MKKITLLFLSLLTLSFGYSQPDTAAPTPTNASADVISVYSDVYQTIATNINPNWQQATVMTEIQISEDKIMKYENLNYQGLEYLNTDVSPMEYVHLDYYTEDATEFQFALIAGSETSYNIGTTDGITLGSWVSIDIPLSHFSNLGSDLSTAGQFKTAGSGTIYLDNIYFWRNTPAQGTDTSLTDLTMNGTTIAGFSSFKSNYAFELPAGTTIAPTLVATTADAGASATTTNAASLPGASTILITSANGSVTNTITVTFTLDPNPTVAAPVPTNASTDVISVYSNTYQTIATNLNPNWSQATIKSEITIGTDKILKLKNLNYQGLEYLTSNVSEMEYLHLDYYTTDATAFQLFLIAGGESAYDIAAENGITKGSWVSIDIPMSAYESLDLTTASQFKITGNGTLFLDNIYFWKTPPPVPTIDTTLSDLTVNGVTVNNFLTKTLVYDVALEYGTTTVPTVVGTPTQSAPATAVTTAASSLPGTTTILVTAQDGTTTATYTLNFTVSDPATPLTAAPTPTNASIDVVSVYSDVFTSIATNLNPGWGQATVMSEITVSEDKILKYENLNYQGLEYTNSDVSAMEYLHIDYYTINATDLNFYLIAGGENAYDIDATDGITIGAWESIDIPLSYFSDAGRNLTTAIQFKISGNGTVYFDNLYFWKAPTAGASDTSLSDLTIDGTTIDGFAPLKSNYTIELPLETTVVPTVIATPTQGDATAVNTNAASIPGATTILVTSSDGTKNTVTINFTLNQDPTTTAPAPTNSSSDVISVYSNTYTNIAANLYPGWGQATIMSEIEVSSDNILKYKNLNYQGIEYGSPANVSGMEYLHLDYFTRDAAAFSFAMIADGETAYDVATTDGIVLNSWVGIDIPLSYFSDAGRNLTNVIQFKTSGNGTLYLDNLYFWKKPLLGINDTEIEGLKTYPNPTNNQWTISTKNQIINSIDIYDTAGKKVISLQPNALSAQIDASHLTTGIYISTITTDSGTVSKKLIKN